MSSWSPISSARRRVRSRCWVSRARSRASPARRARLREEHWSPEDYLRECLAVELASRIESAIKQRLRAAAFPELKTLDEFELDVAESVSAAQLAELARGDWVSAGSIAARAATCPVNKYDPFGRLGANRIPAR